MLRKLTTALWTITRECGWFIRLLIMVVCSILREEAGYLRDYFNGNLRYTGKELDEIFSQYPGNESSERKKERYFRKYFPRT